MTMFGIVRAMRDKSEDRKHILFSVKADARTFPAELWERFRATADHRGEQWIDALRRLIEQYISQGPKP